MTALQDLLAKAIELEEKVADVVERPVLPPGAELLETPPPADDLTDDEVIVELTERLDQLHARLDELTAPPAAAADPDPYAEVLEPADGEKAWGDFGDDDPAGMDFEEPDEAPEVKADCTHPDDEVEEFADGTKRCDACGSEVKALSDDEQMQAWLAATEHLEAKSDPGDTETLSEFELLRAQRAQLGL